MGLQQPIKIKDYDKTCKKRQTLLNKHFCKNKIQVSSGKMADFHFSHYKSMETLSCHSNQSSYPPGIKNTY